LFILF